MLPALACYGGDGCFTHLYVLNFIQQIILTFVLNMPQCPRLNTKAFEETLRRRDAVSRDIWLRVVECWRSSSRVTHLYHWGFV